MHNVEFVCLLSLLWEFLEWEPDDEVERRLCPADGETKEGSRNVPDGIIPDSACRRTTKTAMRMRMMSTFFVVCFVFLKKGVKLNAAERQRDEVRRSQTDGWTEQRAV